MTKNAVLVEFMVNSYMPKRLGDYGSEYNKAINEPKETEP